jgi:AraC-like DNA-binding protein
MMLVYSLFKYLSSDEEGRYKNVEITLSRDEEITGKFLALIDEHCEKEHGLDWYASELCLSTRYVANTVKQTLGITASSCIERALTQRAKTLLCTTTMSIQEIADLLGFQNQSHFGTFFKRHEGVSPAAFRKQQ